MKEVSSVRTGDTAARALTTFATDWTANNNQTGTYNTNPKANDLGINNIIGTRNIFTAAANDVSTLTMDGNSLLSMTGISLNYYEPKYFRSVATGDWNSLSTWQESPNGTTGWVAATTIPSAIDAQVNLQAGYTVTLTANTVSPNLIVNGSLDVSTFTLTGTGTLTANSGSNILIGGTANFPAGFTTTTLNAGSTVNYDGAVQTVSNQAYANLILSGTSAKTLPAGLTSISGNLTFACIS